MHRAHRTDEEIDRFLWEALHDNVTKYPPRSRCEHIDDGRDPTGARIYQRRVYGDGASLDQRPDGGSQQ